MLTYELARDDKKNPQPLLAANEPPTLSYASTVNANVPDGDLSGVSNTITVIGALGLISDVNVTLTLSPVDADVAAGDYFVYISHAGKISYLLNRTGRNAASSIGSEANGFSAVTFDDTAPQGDIHLAIQDTSFPITGVWQPDARATNPTLTLDSDSRSNFLDQFQGENPNGEWTLFVADVSRGGRVQFIDWKIDVITVPEPSGVAFLGFAAFGMLFLRARRSL